MVCLRARIFVTVREQLKYRENWELTKTGVGCKKLRSRFNLFTNYTVVIILAINKFNPTIFFNYLFTIFEEKIGVPIAPVGTERVSRFSVISTNTSIGYYLLSKAVEPGDSVS